MAIEIIQGSDKKIVVDLNDLLTSKPFDLNGVTLMRACFINTDGTSLYKYFVSKTGDIGATTADTIDNIDTTNLQVGFPVVGIGIPIGATILTIGTNTVQLSVPATLVTAGATIAFGDISIVAPAILGTIKIMLHYSETDLLAVGEGKSFEILIERNGFKSYVQFPESLNIVAKYC